MLHGMYGWHRLARKGKIGMEVFTNKRGHKVAKVSLHNCQDDDAQKTAFCQRIEGSSMFCRRTGGIGWLGRKWWIGWRRCQE